MMDKRIIEYFSELDVLLSKTDKKEYNEFKFDLYEHVDIQLKENIPIDLILEKLGSPSDAAKNYLEEKRFFIARTSESDIVIIEDVPDEFKKIKRRKKQVLFDKIKQVGSRVILGILSILFIYFILYVIYELVIEKHLSYIACLIVMSIITWFIFIYKKIIIKKKIQYIIPIFLLIGFFITALTNNVYYKGVAINDDISIDSSGVDTIEINSDYPIEVMTVPVDDTNDITFEIDGYLKKSQKNILKESYDNQAVLINIKKNYLFDMLTKLETLKLILYIPKDITYSTLKSSFKNGFVQLNGLEMDKIDISVKKGEVHLSEVYNSNITIESDKADININGFSSDVTIENNKGKTILKNGSGNLSVSGKNPFSNLIDINSDKTDITTEFGKVVVNNTSIGNLKIEGENSIIVGENQIGNTVINSTKGKVILTDMGGRLDLNTNDSTVIITQENTIEGELINRKGLIKWVQSQNSNLSFDLEDSKGRIVDTYTGSNKSDITYRINNINGEVYLYPMGSVAKIIKNR